jgi:hypothetical protein
MEKETAKDKVINICELLSACYPHLPDETIQEAAIDLHDIEHACRDISQRIYELRNGAVLAENVLGTLDKIEYELVSHVGRTHLPTLRTFIKTCNAQQRIEEKAKRRRDREGPRNK